jgi:hypothetical protein
MKWNALRTFALFSLGVAPVLASPIFVSNFSFETLPGAGLPNTGCGSGCAYSTTAIPGWTTVGTGGQFQPGTPANTAYFTSLSDGPTSAYSNGTGAIISQTVIPTVVLGEVYTLMVDIGSRLDEPFDGTAAILINGNTYNATGTTPTRGTFGTFTATYTGLLADVGKPITIELLSTGEQGNFDNVRLDGAVLGTANPEPASFVLMGSALLALTGILRRRTA